MGGGGCGDGDDDGGLCVGGRGLRRRPFLIIRLVLKLSSLPSLHVYQRSSFGRDIRGTWIHPSNRTMLYKQDRRHPCTTAVWPWVSRLVKEFFVSFRRWLSKLLWYKAMLLILVVIYRASRNNCEWRLKGGGGNPSITEAIRNPDVLVRAGDVCTR